MNRALLVIPAAFLVAIAAAQYAYRVSSDPGDEPVYEPWAQNKMEFVAWNGARWTAWIHGDKFEQVPVDSRKWSRHANASIAFKDWDGEPWQAKIDGDVFLLAYEGNWQQPAGRSEALRFRDWSGQNQIRTVAELKR